MMQVAIAPKFEQQPFLIHCWWHRCSPHITTKQPWRHNVYLFLAACSRPWENQSPFPKYAFSPKQRQAAPPHELVQPCHEPDQVFRNVPSGLHLLHTMSANTQAHMSAHPQTLKRNYVPPRPTPFSEAIACSVEIKYPNNSRVGWQLKMCSVINNTASTCLRLFSCITELDKANASRWKGWHGSTSSTRA